MMHKSLFVLHLHHSSVPFLYFFIHLNRLKKGISLYWLIKGENVSIYQWYIDEKTFDKSEHKLHLYVTETEVWSSNSRTKTAQIVKLGAFAICFLECGSIINHSGYFFSLLTQWDVFVILHKLWRYGMNPNIVRPRDRFGFSKFL